MATAIPVVTIPPPPVRGRYARHVIENGHYPKVLSGAELLGKARKHSGWYWRIRRRVIEHAAAHGVHASLVRHPLSNRWSRIWTDENGSPVRVVVAG